MSCICSASERAVAQPLTTPPAPSACARVRGSAIMEAACSVAQNLGALPAGALVVAAPLVSDARLERPSELAARLRTAAASALGLRVSDELASLSRARTLARSAPALLFIEPEILRGQLRLSATWYGSTPSFWERVREPRPSPKAHAFASVRLDAELHGFMPATPLVAGHVDKGALAARDVVALACGDVDDDGSLELVLLGRQNVALARLRSGKVAVLAARPWSELSEVAGSPLREPIAGVALTPGRFIDLGSTDRAEAVRLDPALQVRASFGQRIPWPSGGCSRVVNLALEGRSARCHPGDPELSLSDFDFPADAIASAEISQLDGTSRFVYAERIANDTTVVVRARSQPEVRFGSAGAQLAIADLDLDGQPEILSSSDTLDPEQDVLIVRTWLSSGALSERFRIPVPGGVRALAACPAEGNAQRAIALVTRDEIWIAR